jgi:hypothetical protein
LPLRIVRDKCKKRTRMMRALELGPDLSPPVIITTRHPALKELLSEEEPDIMSQ